MAQKNLTNVEIIAFGVAQGTKGRARTPVYFATQVFEDGTVVQLETEYPSWQAATAGAKDLAAKETERTGEHVGYMIADQIKAFQKRLQREAAQAAEEAQAE